MAVRYFCDNCGLESDRGNLKVVVIAIPPQSEAIDVCPECLRQFSAQLERCVRMKRHGELPHSRALQRRALAGYRAVMEIPGVGVIGRALSFVGIFVVFFVAVTLLTSLR